MRRWAIAFAAVLALVSTQPVVAATFRQGVVQNFKPYDSVKLVESQQVQHVNPDELEHAAGRERENLEGSIPSLASDADFFAARVADSVIPAGGVGAFSDTSHGSPR